MFDPYNDKRTINQIADTADNVVKLPRRVRKLRADVPPFDPSNPKHIAAWEALWDCGLAFSRTGN